MYREAMKDLRRLVSLDSSNAGGCYTPSPLGLSPYRREAGVYLHIGLDGARGPEL